MRIIPHAHLRTCTCAHMHSHTYAHTCTCMMPPRADPDCGVDPQPGRAAEGRDHKAGGSVRAQTAGVCVCPPLPFLPSHHHPPLGLTARRSLVDRIKIWGCMSYTFLDTSCHHRCLSAYLPVSMYLRLSVRPPARPSACLPVCPSFCLSSVHVLPICLSVHLSAAAHTYIHLWAGVAVFQPRPSMCPLAPDQPPGPALNVLLARAASLATFPSCCRLAPILHYSSAVWHKGNFSPGSFCGQVHECLQALPDGAHDVSGLQV